MITETKCICGAAATWHGICEECKALLKVRSIKKIEMVEAIRKIYNDTHRTYKTYGQFVAYIDAINRRKKEFDDRGKKATAKKIWAN